MVFNPQVTTYKLSVLPYLELPVGPMWGWLVLSWSISWDLKSLQMPLVCFLCFKELPLWLALQLLVRSHICCLPAFILTFLFQVLYMTALGTMTQASTLLAAWYSYPGPCSSPSQLSRNTWQARGHPSRLQVERDKTICWQKLEL